MTQGFGATHRREFVRAFVDQAWARPGTERPTSRLHVALMVTVGTLAVAVLAGVVLQLIHPVPLHRPEPVAAAPVSAPPRYTAVSGWDCEIAPDRGFDLTGRTPAWYTVARGGWAGDGCHGTFEAIPLSGKATAFDQSQSAVWWFVPGADMHRCELAVYLPAPEHRVDSAATKAQFTVLSGRGGGPLASSVVDLTTNPGTWRVLGTFPVSQAGIAVRLVNQGVAGATDRLAVTQVRATCTGGQ